jgi:hypothetical protein
MNTVRIGVITVCLAVGASVYLSLRGAAPDEVRPAQEIRAQTENESRDAVHSPETRAPGKVSEPAFEPDETELLQPSQTFDEVLEAVNADIGPDGEYVDREKLAGVLSSDPELGRLLDESEF